MPDTIPIYVGNYQNDADERELERAFEKYGRVAHVEFKPMGYCFVHYEDKRDAEEAIHDLHDREWGSKRRRLKVEFAKNDADVREKQAQRRAEAVPNETLFVAGYDHRTMTSDVLKKSFEGFGNLKRCEMKKTFAFVEYETIDDAKEALSAMHGAQIEGREITVEFVNKKPSERRERPRRGGGGGGDRRRGGGGRDRDGPRGGGSRYDDRDRDRGGRDRERDYRSQRSPVRRDYGGRYDDRDRDRGRDLDRRDDRRGAYSGGGGGGGRRDRSRSYERRDRRRDPPPRGGGGGGGGGGRGRDRSPPPRRGRSPPPRRSPPAPERRPRSRSPAMMMATDAPSPPRGGPVRRRGDSPSRSRSPMRADD